MHRIYIVYLNMKTITKSIETNEMTFKTWKEFQSAIASKLYLNISGKEREAELNGDLRTWKKLALAENHHDFLKALTDEILWMIDEKIITMKQAVAAGFVESDLLID